MVHGIVQQCAGALRLHSSRPGGTTVDMWLPLADPAMRFTVQAAAAREMPSAAALAAEPISILVVDDDPLVLSTTVEMLCFAGYEAVGASSAKQALKLLDQSSAFSILVTDHAMPGMTGVELAASVAESHPAIRVVLASGYAELPDDAPGVIARLQKPYGRADLLAAIRSG
jgi:CheY-like chemotaxis protein